MTFPTPTFYFNDKPVKLEPFTPHLLADISHTRGQVSVPVG